MQRDRRLTGYLRGQTDKPEAPEGFELNNPWKVGKAMVKRLRQMLTLNAAREAGFVNPIPMRITFLKPVNAKSVQFYIRESSGTYTRIQYMHHLSSDTRPLIPARSGLLKLIPKTLSNTETRSSSFLKVCCDSVLP